MKNENNKATNGLENTTDGLVLTGPKNLSEAGPRSQARLVQ